MRWWCVVSAILSAVSSAFEKVIDGLIDKLTDDRRRMLEAVDTSGGRRNLKVFEIKDGDFGIDGGLEALIKGNDMRVWLYVNDLIVFFVHISILNSASIISHFIFTK